MSTLRIKDLHVSVETSEGPKEILKGVNLTIESGEIHAIMGPNGSGKSTMAYALAEAGNGPCLGIFGVEFFVRGDDVWFSELSPRPHDTGMVTMVTQAQSEFELHARAILGLPVSTAQSTPGASAVIKSTSAVDAPVYNGVAHALESADIVRLFGKPVSRAGRRVGVVATTASTPKEARVIARRAAARRTGPASRGRSPREPRTNPTPGAVSLPIPRVTRVMDYPVRVLTQRSERTCRVCASRGKANVTQRTHPARHHYWWRYHAGVHGGERVLGPEGRPDVRYLHPGMFKHKL